jgi:hypothetical protein
MSKVVYITNQLEEKKLKDRRQDLKQKVETVQRIVHCSSCQFKCAMCGLHCDVVHTPSPETSPHYSLRLCDNCRSEYEDFLKMTLGKEKSHVLWHNDEWVNLWSAWLKYQKALRSFEDSAEFSQLTREFYD